MDIESERDTARVKAEKRKIEICRDLEGAVNMLIGDLQGIGLSGNCGFYCSDDPGGSVHIPTAAPGKNCLYLLNSPF